MHFPKRALPEKEIRTRYSSYFEHFLLTKASKPHTRHRTDAAYPAILFVFLFFSTGSRHQSGNEVIVCSFDSTCTVSGLGASELDSEAPELRAPEVTFGRAVEGVSDSLTPGPLLNAPNGDFNQMVL